MTASSLAPPLILLVEDDDIVRTITGALLRDQGFAAIEAVDFATAQHAFGGADVELALIDVGLPDGSGFELARQLRARRDCAIIYLTSFDAAEDRLRGLEGDGDDYLVKPIDARELAARVRAVWRRYRRAPRDQAAVRTVLEFGGWTLDLVRRELAAPRGALVPLTRAEFDLFAALVQADGRALDRDYLLEVSASAESDTKRRTIDVLVSRIRRKLAQGPPPLPRIVTAQGEGYRFGPPAS